MKIFTGSCIPVRPQHKVLHTELLMQKTCWFTIGVWLQGEKGKWVSTPSGESHSGAIHGCLSPG